MNRADLQQLAKLRIKEAEVLLNNGSYEGAYYLAGYAVECALKACIAKLTKRFDFPLDPKTVQRTVYIHDITELLKSARLTADFEREIQSNLVFKNNWGIVKDWSEQSRYETRIAEADARDLFTAIAGRRNGVLSWLRKYW